MSTPFPTGLNTTTDVGKRHEMFGINYSWNGKAWEAPVANVETMVAAIGGGATVPGSLVQLNAGGKIDNSLLSIDFMEYKGLLDPTNPITSVVPAAPIKGDVWYVSKAGILTGWVLPLAVPIDVHTRDILLYDGTAWELIGGFSVEVASNAEIDAGVDNLKTVTPAGLKHANKFNVYTNPTGAQKIEPTASSKLQLKEFAAGDVVLEALDTTDAPKFTVKGNGDIYSANLIQGSQLGLGRAARGTRAIDIVKGGSAPSDVYTGLSVNVQNTGTGNAIYGAQVDLRENNGADSVAYNVRLDAAHTHKDDVYGFRISEGNQDSHATDTFSVKANGEVTAAGDIKAFTGSDKRLKSNIKPIENALEKTLKLSGATFEQEGYEGRQAGVIAQDVLEVLPEIVTERDNGMLAIKYDRLTALLIEAVKEQNILIKELSAEVKELKNGLAS